MTKATEALIAAVPIEVCADEGHVQVDGLTKCFRCQTPLDVLEHATKVCPVGEAKTPKHNTRQTQEVAEFAYRTHDYEGNELWHHWTRHVWVCINCGERAWWY